ncbi:hypothetical protein [Chryseobacterium sp. P1-3]|uniref:hypothetical protein n=1 Tax=Chryseobacterium sp. (strain P1-3) TaxID=1517683 RepID=UPI0012FF3540|nr:hypothetical protein [Chryseobacterium sp. P1-3]
MKNFLLTTALFFSSMAFSQVGINTASPKSTLDVSAKEMHQELQTIRRYMA